MAACRPGSEAPAVPAERGLPFQADGASHPQASGRGDFGVREVLEPVHGDLAEDGELREYVMAHHLLLYARIARTVYLLSIRHQRQLSFDFEGLWRG